MATAEPEVRMIRRQYTTGAAITNAQGPMVKAGQTAPSAKAPEKPAVVPAKATPAKAAPQAGSQPKAPAKAPAKATPKAMTIAAKSPIGKTIKARYAEGAN